MSLEPGRTLSHHRLVEPIGHGGMGVVWKAVDTDLHRTVAIKVLAPRHADDPEYVGRLRREARAIAALDHPNVVTIYAVEEAEGFLFLSMEYVPGLPLDAVIPTGGLPAAAFRSYAAQLADALTAAHERGIVHRDLKPGNVIVRDDGRIKVLDFGLAKMDGDPSPTAATGSFSDAITREGFTVGTPAYMSPEQLEGKPLDLRTDLFSLGVVLYQMATSRKPFAGASIAALTSSILRDEPSPLGPNARDWPRSVEATIRRCLAKDPAHRPSTAAEIRDALWDAGDERGAGTGASPQASRPVGSKPSIAVLPFRNLGRAPDEEYFADGLAEDLITGLSRYPWLTVIARNSTFVFRDPDSDARSVARELGARYVLMGSVRRADQRVRLTAQLVDGESGMHVWTERYDRRMHDIFELQDELTRTIAGAIEPAVGEAERRRAVSRAGNLDAWEHYHRGVAHLHRRTPEDLAEARRYLERAIGMDPTLVAAYAAGAEACFFMIVGGFAEDPSRHAEEGLALARQGVEIDPHDPGARYALGRMLLVQRAPEAAVEELRTAVELNPSFAWAHYALGMAYATSGRPEDSLEPIREAMRLSPRDPYRGQFMVRMGEALLFLGRNEDALEWAERSLREPNIQWSRHALRAAILGHLGRSDEARDAVAALQRERPEITVSRVAQWWPVSNAEALAVLLDGLRRAGLPEG